MIILGIDPGSSGGIVAVKAESNVLPKIILAIRMPTVSIYGKKIIDTKKISLELSKFLIDISIIEKVHAMPRQGVTSSFQFGRNFGGLETLSYLFAKRVDYVAPAVWKKALGLGTTKKDSLDLARLKFGDLDLWKIKSNDGVAEAALLALFWIEKHMKL
jgi:crossover junction endodeoxyribonuclease RuvC